MKKIVAWLLIVASVAFADRLDIVDEMMSSGAKEQFNAEWQEAYRPLKLKIEESKMPIRLKRFLDDTFANIGKDEKLVREIIKLEVQVMTEGMSDKELKEFRWQLRNPILQKTNQLIIRKQIKNKITDQSGADIEKFTAELKKRMTKEEYENYRKMAFSGVNLKAMSNLYNEISNGNFDTDMARIFKNMIFGKRVVVEMREQKIY